MYLGRNTIKMDLRLKYQISGTTNLSTDVIIEKIKQELVNKKYRILDSNDQSIEFDINPWRMAPRGEEIKISGGKFEIGLIGEQVVVTLSYYNHIVMLLLISTVFMVFVSTSAPIELILVFALFFTIVITLAIIAGKSKGQELLNDILGIQTS